LLCKNGIAAARHWLLIVVKLGVVIVIKWIDWYGVLWRKTSRDLIAARRVGSEEDSVELADEVEVCRGLII